MDAPSLLGIVPNWFYNTTYDQSKSHLTELERSLHALHSAAKELAINPDAIDRISLKQRKLQLLAKYDDFQLLFLKCLGKSEVNHTLLRAERELITKELKLDAPPPKFTPFLAREIEKALHLDPQSNPTCLLTPEEKSFVESYLASDPCYSKTLTLYQFIQRKAETIRDDLAPYQLNISVNGKQYAVYDLDGVSYQFIGSAGRPEAIADDYQGYLDTRWPFLCSSLIDEHHPFFCEDLRFVFQVLSVPPETIVHTSHRDLYTPYSKCGAKLQPFWYALNRRAQVIAAYVNRLHHHLSELKNQDSEESGRIPFVTPIDQELRLLKMAQQWSRILSDIQPSSSYIKHVRRLILDAAQRQNTDANSFLKTLTTFKHLLGRSTYECAELFLKLKELEAENPHFRADDFADQDEKVNRVTLQLQELIDYYQNEPLTPDEQKLHYRHLFSTDDTSGHYDILGELTYLERIIKRLPSRLEIFSTRLNRFMGPYEVLSETSHSLNNEINLDMNVAGGCKVKALLLSKKFLVAHDQQVTKELQDILDLAERENIPVLFRSKP